MVFNSILFVHGTLVTREELFKFVKDVLHQEIPERKDHKDDDDDHDEDEEDEEDDDEEDEDEDDDDEDDDDDYEERCDDFIEGYYNSKIYGDMNLYPYPCCSKLNGKKYIIGQVVQNAKIDDIADTACPLDTDVPRVTVERFAKKFGFSSPRIYMMLDDCVYCS